MTREVSRVHRRRVVVYPRSDGQGPRSEPRRTTATAWRVLATVVSPLAVVTALLFYYGWDRTKVEAEDLGYDSSLLDFSVQDYVLRSINVLFVPLMLVLLLAVLLHWMHTRFVAPRTVAQGARPPLRRTNAVLISAGVVLIPLGVLLAVVAPAAGGLAISAALAATVVSALYGDALRRRVRRPRAFPGSFRVLLVVVLALSTFWATEQMARIMGDQYANQIEADPASLVGVTVYSAKRLDLNVPGVVESAVSLPDSAYPFRYDGLRLLQRSGGRYFLISQQWDPHRRLVIMLQDNDQMRLEFFR